MILTIGYSKLRPENVLDLVKRTASTLVDVRSIPQSRVKGWSKSALEKLFGTLYEYRGDKLGGKKACDPRAIEQLKHDGKAKNLMLLCLEELPLECHRHTAICGLYIRDALHLVPQREQAVYAGELEDYNRDKTPDYLAYSIQEAVEIAQKACHK